MHDGGGAGEATGQTDPRAGVRAEEDRGRRRVGRGVMACVRGLLPAGSET